MIDIIEMDEHQVRAVLVPVLHCAAQGFARTFKIFHRIRDARLNQPPEAVPIMKNRDVRLRLLLAKDAEDRRESAASGREHGGEFELMRLPFI
jgi:hypothetical protein